MSEILQSLKSNADAIIGTGGFFVGLTSVIVALRLIARPLLNIRLGVEDFFLVAGLLLFWVETALVFEGASLRPLQILRLSSNCMRSCPQRQAGEQRA